MTKSSQVSICLLFVCLSRWSATAFQYTANDNGHNSWESFAPGRLLENLDKFTNAAVADEVYTMATTTTSSTTPATSIAHRKADEDEKDNGEVDGDDESTEQQQGDVDGSDDISAVDYERTYEQFVNKYFDRADDENTDTDGHLADTSDEADAHDQSTSIETHDIDDDNEYDYEPVPRASNVRAKHERCKNVRRNKQQCKICKNPRNNEVSEMCSYSHEDTPQKYAYGSEKQYKRYKDDESDEGTSKDAEADADSISREETKRRHYRAKSNTTKSRMPKPQLQSEPSSLCVRKLLRQKVCYHCEDSTGKKLSRCYDAPRTHKRRNAAEQRIYKRTVAYETYEQASTNDTEATPAKTVTPTVPVEHNSARSANETVLITPAPPPTVPPPSNAVPAGFRRRHTLYKVVRKQRLN